MSEVKRLEDLEEEEFPLKMVQVQGDNPGDPVEHQFFILRAGTGFLRFAEDKGAIEAGKMPPTLFLTLNETSNGLGPIEPAPAKPAHILVGFEFPNKEAFDVFMDGFNKFGERHFPENP